MLPTFDVVTLNISSQAMFLNCFRLYKCYCSFVNVGYMWRIIYYWYLYFWKLFIYCTFIKYLCIYMYMCRYMIVVALSVYEIIWIYLSFVGIIGVHLSFVGIIWVNIIWVTRNIIKHIHGGIIGQHSAWPLKVIFCNCIVIWLHDFIHWNWPEVDHIALIMNGWI